MQIPNNLRKNVVYRTNRHDKVSQEAKKELKNRLRTAKIEYFQKQIEIYEDIQKKTNFSNKPGPRQFDKN